MRNNPFAPSATHKLKSSIIASMLVMGIGVAPGAAADWYFGAKAGPMMIDTAGVGDPTNAGILIGHEWGVVLGDVGIEGEFTTSINKGKYAGNDVSVDTRAVYGVFRTAGAVYLIAKAGMLHEEVKIGPVSSTDSGSSVGLGVGFSIGVAQFEVEYTQIEKDIAFVSLGLRF